ncbi:MAG: gamma-glutamylcyclotransferase [Polyangiales bacterium]
MTSRYFAYGSNLNVDDFRRYCTENGLDASVLRPLGRAFLPDHEPVFHYRSSERGGGVLDVRPRRGIATPGALFEVMDGFEVLDRKEGVSTGAYRRVRVTALTDDGRSHEVETYVVDPSRHGPHVPPSDEYLKIVSTGLARHRHDTAMLRAAAAGRRPACDPSSVFVYGTLRRGESRGSSLEHHDPLEEGKGVVHGTVRGKLLDLGEYPGLLPTDDPHARVHGELYTFFELEKVFGELDAIEDFLGYGVDGSLYHRVLVRVDLDGRERLAWTYVYVGPLAGTCPIESGDWVGYRVARDAAAPSPAL